MRTYPTNIKERIAAIEEDRKERVTQLQNWIIQINQENNDTIQLIRNQCQHVPMNNGFCDICGEMLK